MHTMKKGEIFLCAINNVQSGGCSEDCRFCTQSARYRAEIPRYPCKAVKEVVKEARFARKRGAVGYCLVTAGKGLDEEKTEYLAKLASEIRSEIADLRLIACAGTASVEQLRYLGRHGIESYNHNLETSRRYYPKLCTTHSWEERYSTCEAVRISGLKLCCGGIFGMGETWEDRESLLDEIASLQPASVPLNFYIPNPALPLQKCTITPDEALEIIAKASKIVEKSSILMIAGGREYLLGGREKEMFSAGANAIVLGDYLTASGTAPERDIERIESLGYTVAGSCNE